MQALFGIIVVLVIAWFLFSEDSGPVMKINVPSDSSAVYFDEGSRKMEGELVQIHTKRVGSSGFSHAIRIINCDEQTFDYVYDSDDRPERFPVQSSSLPNSRLVKGSISFWVAGYACKKHGFRTSGW